MPFGRGPKTLYELCEQGFERASTLMHSDKRLENG